MKKLLLKFGLPMKYFIYLIFTILFFSSVKAENPTTISISTEEYAPFIAKSLKKNGPFAILLTEAFKTQGIKTKFTFLPAARGFQLTKSGAYDGSVPWAKRKSRLSHFYYGEPLIESDKEVFYYLKEKEFEWDPKKQNYSLLKGKTVGVINGANYGPAFNRAVKTGIIKTIPVTKTIQNFKMLLLKRIDLLITPYQIANVVLNNDLKIEEAKKISVKLAIDEEVEYDYLLISKKSPNGKYFLNAMNKGLKEIKKSGQYKTILKEANLLPFSSKNPSKKKSK